MSDSVDSQSNLSALIAGRDYLEAELLKLHNQLKELNTTMTEPLVDGDGYPRSDIDLYAVRQVRNQIICKENDYKALTKEIEEGLYALHAKSKVVLNESCKNQKEVQLKPFAVVDVVDPNSPAAKADLKVGDLLVKFGTIKFRNFENLSEVAKLVNENLKKPIHVSVLRDDKLVPLILVPDEWSGKGHLGCRIQPIR